MKILKVVFPTLALAAGLAISAKLSEAKPEYTKKEKKACTFCHVDAKAKPKELNAAGKYYKEHDSLEGYKPR